MGELRRHALTGRRTLVAPGRTLRPVDTRVEWEGLPDEVASCPFCPGNEDELPAILWEVPGPDGIGWRFRSVPNRYPSLGPAGHGSTVPGAGTQEVLIETPVHGLDLSRMTLAEMAIVVEGYRTRYRVQAEADPQAHVILFKNRGAEAGNSLIHPHAQLFALRDPVPEIHHRHREAAERWAREGRCGLCALDALEPRYDERIVAENPAFVALVPWAPSTSGEVWIVPRVHDASFGQLSGPDVGHLAEILSTVLGQYRFGLGDPAYNAIWHGGRMNEQGADHLHWHIQIVPKVARRAGFELASGVDVCPSDPIEDASVLRDALDQSLFGGAG